MISLESSCFPFCSTIFVSSNSRLLNSISSDLSLLTSSTRELSISFSFSRVLLSIVNCPCPIILTILVLLTGFATTVVFPLFVLDTFDFFDEPALLLLKIRGLCFNVFVNTLCCLLELFFVVFTLFFLGFLPFIVVTPLLLISYVFI